MAGPFPGTSGSEKTSFQSILATSDIQSEWGTFCSIPQQFLWQEHSVELDEDSSLVLKVGEASLHLYRDNIQMYWLCNCRSSRRVLTFANKHCCQFFH